MRALPIVAMLFLASPAAGCTEAPRAASGALSPADRWSTSAPQWIAEAELIEVRAGLELLALPIVRGPEQTDVRPPRAIVAHRDGLYLSPSEPVIAARIVADRIAWVTVEGALVIDDGETSRTIDRDAIAELAVAPDGRTLAWPQRPGPDAGVRVIDASDPDARPRLVTPGLEIADRPLFVDASTLIVVGSQPSGIAGVWLVRWSARDPHPIAITNGALRTGVPFGPSYVPPPADHGSMRVEHDVLRYDDGRGEQQVDLSEGGAR